MKPTPAEAICARDNHSPYYEIVSAGHSVSHLCECGKVTWTPSVSIEPHDLGRVIASDDEQQASAGPEEGVELSLMNLLKHHGAGEGLLVDWTIVTAQHVAEDDGSSSTALGLWTPETQPIHRTMGLIEYAATRLRNTSTR